MIWPKRCTGLILPVHESPRPFSKSLFFLFHFAASLLCILGYYNVAAQETSISTSAATKHVSSNNMNPGFADIEGVKSSKQIAFNQEQDLVTRTIKSVGKKSESLEGFLTRKSEYYIERAQAAELRVMQSVIELKGAPQNEIEKTKMFYSEILQRFRSHVPNPGSAREYLPKMDSLMTSALFLNKFSESKEFDRLGEQFADMQNKYFQVANIQKEIANRFESLFSRYQGKLPLKELRKIHQLSETFKAQVQEFKNLLNNPVPKVERLIDMAVQQQGFEEFFASNAELSRLFRNPKLKLAKDSTLQTIGQLEEQLKNKFGISGKSLLAKQQKTGQQAIAGVQAEMLTSLLGNSLSNRGSDQINTESVKPVRMRFSFNVDIRSQRSNGWLPAYSELGINVGYRMSPRFVAGLGASGRIGWGKGLSELNVTMEGVGIRSFLEYKIKGGIFFTGGFEAVYDPLPDIQTRSSNISQWQKNGLVGLKKGFRVNNGFIKGASIKLMWNYLSYSQPGIVQPFDFRIGYDF